MSGSGVQFSFNVLTINTHKGFTAFNRRFILPELREAVRTVGADIVCLQEVMGAHEAHSLHIENWPDTSHYEFLADTMWSDFAYGRNAVYPQGHHGNAVLSRYPIEHYENRDVSVGASEKRGVLYCRIVPPMLSHPIHVMCVHLGLREAHRQAQLAMLADWVNALPDAEPVVIAGDFNDWRQTANRPLKAKAGLDEIFTRAHGRPARTFPVQFPLLRLDRIYVHAALLEAARRGIKAEVLLDGYGSPDLSDSFVEELTVAGVVFRYYDPRPRLFGMRTNLFRRMHRKIVVIDDRVAFVGGINYSAEHMSDYGPEAKQDYAVRVEGPVVADILKFVLENLPGQSAVRRWWRRHHRAIDNHRPGEAQALFVWRDNEEHRDDIERHYLKMLTQARREVIIANAYFFPGYRFLHALRKAARRGVRVKLIVQGEPDMPIVKVGARLLYNYLVKGGVHVYEYRRKPLHGKVALMDDHWATVGSSNLDPLSLSLNLEANLIIHDRTFNQTLRDNLNPIIAQDCKRVDESMLPKRTWWNLTKSVLAFHFLRHFPALVGWLPAHTPHLAEVEPPAQPALETQDRIQTEDAGGKT